VHSVGDKFKSIHGEVHSITDCKYCKNSSGCYLNANISALYVLFYNCVQLARSFKTKCCNHASPLRNKFSASIAGCQKLNTEDVTLKILRLLLKALEMATLF
jgi:hypothetical protein